MSSKLVGKVAVITASTEGIGFAIAQRLGRDGAKVVISSRKQKNVDRALKDLKSENINAFGMVCHVSKQEHRQNLFEKTKQTFGGIDILVSNAAANPAFGPMMSTTEAQWDKIFETNVKATFFLCQEVVPYMKERGGGSIVLVSSIAGFMPSEFLGPYSVSKTALLGMTKAMTPECAASNIRVNCLAPGIIKTRFSEALTTNDSVSEAAKANIPLKRFGTPDECAGIVSFLASDDASFITGETVVVAGGLITGATLRQGIVFISGRSECSVFGTPDECAGIVSFLASDDASFITGETVVVAGGTPSRL